MKTKAVNSDTHLVFNCVVGIELRRQIELLPQALSVIIFVDLEMMVYNTANSEG